MRHRPVITITVSLGITIALALPAAAAPSTVDAELVDRYTQVSYELVGSAASAAVMEVEKTVVNTKGQVLSRSSYRKAAADRRAISPMRAAPFACLNDREREDFERHNFWEVLDEEGNEFVHFRYFPYSQRRAQRIDGQVTQQWLVCATGGVDAQNGSRISVSGPVVAYRNEQATFKIGQVWREGRTPADHTVSLGFQVGKGPVAVNGSIQQNSTEKLKGSPLALFNDNRYGRNQAAAWWEHGCRPTCRRWNGSAEFQGSVAEALFEFPDAMPVDPGHFYYSASVEHFCSNPFGC
jgi:hypothetical protein